MRLSICMMVKDEENNLKRCLDNLKPIVDLGLAELIIVDTGSSDNTVSIANEYTDKVYFHQWNKNFSEMRNITISYAKGEWILIIDADERLDDFDKLITLLKSEELDSFNSVFIQVKNLTSYTDEDKYDVLPSPRLFKNDGAFRYEGAVHNQPIFNGPNLNTDIYLTHYGYIVTDKELMEKKFNRTVELLKNELSEKPEDLYYLYQLGISYDMHGDRKESLDEFRKAYKILKRKNLLKNKDYVYILSSFARILYSNGELEESLKVAKEVLSVKKDYVDMYYIAGLIENRLGNEAESIKYLKKYISLTKVYTSLDIAKDLTIIMYHIDKMSISNANFEIYKHYFNRQKYKEAYEMYKDINMINQRIYAGTNILLKLKKYEELKDLYTSICDENTKERFLLDLEGKIKSMNLIDKLSLYKEFSHERNDKYSILNRIRLNNFNHKVEVTDGDIEIISKLEFNNLNYYYGDIIYYLMKNNIDVSYILNIRENKVINFINYIGVMYEDFNSIVYEYLLNNNVQELNSVRLNKILCKLLIIDQFLNKEKNDDVIYKYVNESIDYLHTIYKQEVFEYELISDLKNDEEEAILYIDKAIKSNDKLNIVKYLKKALGCCPEIKNVIELLMNELLRDVENKTDEMSVYKAQIKENIKDLIEIKKYNEAIELIKQYETVVKDDIEILQLKSKIMILKE